MFVLIQPQSQDGQKGPRFQEGASSGCSVGQARAEVRAEKTRLFKNPFPSKTVAQQLSQLLQ